MRFSDIQKDPRNYDTDILVGKLENYFTTTIENCPFIDQLDTPSVELTLTEEEEKHAERLVIGDV